MAQFFRYHFFAIFALLLLTSVFVNSLPTSVLVDEKQQQNEQSSSAALNKGKFIFHDFPVIRIKWALEIFAIKLG